MSISVIVDQCRTATAGLALSAQPGAPVVADHPATARPSVSGPFRKGIAALLRRSAARLSPVSE